MLFHKTTTKIIHKECIFSIAVFHMSTQQCVLFQIQIIIQNLFRKLNATSECQDTIHCVLYLTLWAVVGNY